MKNSHLGWQTLLGEREEVSIPYDFNREMKLIDERYKAENRLLEAVASGKEEEAIEALASYGNLMRSPDQKPSPTSSDMLRDFKNSIMTMNALFRKAVEEKHVHPIYIHESSSLFGTKIELAETMDELVKVIREMISQYCYLAREKSLAPYSKSIKEAIVYINLNLASPISTSTIARALYLSPNYLSSQFRKELGVSLSEYIRKTRMERVKKALVEGELSIQEVALSVGIEDFSYFCKLFKRETGVSPTEYRRSNIPAS